MDKTCNYCQVVGLAYTFVSGETICQPCLKLLGHDGRALRQKLYASFKEIEQLKEDHGKTCLLVAKMHFAATGSHDGPKRGVVEDVEDVRADLAAAQSLRAEAEGEVERAYEAAEATIRAEIADGGTSCHWCMEKAKADGHREGMVAAAGIVEQYLTDHGYLVGAYGMIRNILATASEPAKVPEVCEWKRIEDDTVWQSSCGYVRGSRPTGVVCGICHKPITVRGG